MSWQNGPETFMSEGSDGFTRIYQMKSVPDSASTGTGTHFITVAQEVAKFKTPKPLTKDVSTTSVAQTESDATPIPPTLTSGKRAGSHEKRPPIPRSQRRRKAA